MAGIVFMKTKDLNKVKNFYISEVGASLWLEQEDCIILKHGNFLFGFCDRGEVDKGWLLTFFYKTKEEVDEMYTKMKNWAASAPKENPKYRIYHFFAKDPEEREIEFQAFLYPMDFDWDS